MNLKPGDIGFVMHHDNPLSRAIAWFMGSQWSHSFIVFGECNGKILVVETSDLQVVINEADRYDTDPNVTMEVFRPMATTDRCLEAALKAQALNGTVYGFLQLFSFGLRRLLRRVGIKIPNFIRVGLVCDAVPLTGWYGSTIPDLKNVDPKSIDTEELYQIVSGNEAQFQRVYQKQRS